MDKQFIKNALAEATTMTSQLIADMTTFEILPPESTQRWLAIQNKFEAIFSILESPGLTVVPNKTSDEFDAIVYFNRGLGAEFMNLKPILTNSYSSAVGIAESEVLRYFAEHDGYEKALIKEIKVRPKWDQKKSLLNQ